jgi:hypothetical protein
MSCDAKAKPDKVNERQPRNASAIASHVDSQSPPQCTGNLSSRQPSVEYRLGALIKQPLPLTPSRRGAGKYNRLPLSEPFTQQVEHQLVVDDGIRVVHAHRVRAVVEDDGRMGDAFAEVGLKRNGCMYV